MKIGEEKNLLLGLAQDLHPLDNAHAEGLVSGRTILPTCLQT